MKVKRGQFAHIDHDPNNNDIDNIVFLCFEHHDEYDSGTSQSASITANELKNYRKKLYDCINDELDSAAEWNTTEHLVTSYWLYKQGPTRAEIEEALDFHAGPHRTRGALRMLMNGPKSMDTFKASIPGDPNWISVIVTALVANGYAFGPISDKNEFRISPKGERLLRVLDEIPEFIKIAWWGANWNIGQQPRTK